MSESSQACYERLRETVVCTGRLPDDLDAARFKRRGLSGLIAWPGTEAILWAELVGATRPAWTPYGDPRVESLAAIYQVLVTHAHCHGSQSHHDILTPQAGRG